MKCRQSRDFRSWRTSRWQDLSLAWRSYLAYCASMEIHTLKKDKAKEDGGKSRETFAELLRGLHGRQCEFVVDGALLYLDIAYSVRGIVADSDDDWVLITSKKGKKVLQRMFRISLIKDVKEIIQ